MQTFKTRVAIESSVIAHGLPHPVNMKAERVMREAIESKGCEPAMIALLDGKLSIGLTRAQVSRIVSADRVEKTSMKDISRVIASGAIGATTVASTIWCAKRAGIDVSVTGGIGGVHRGDRFDVSADIVALGETPATLVCSGAKTILDLRGTREALETHGVTVIGYRTDRFPAFYTRESALDVDERCDSVSEIADIVKTRDALGITSAILVCVPVPSAAALPADDLESLIAAAHRAADMSNVSAAALTPFLLDYLTKHSDGRTLEANLALLENNARIAAEIASALVATEG